MTIRVVGLVVVLGLGLASCNENQPAKTEAPARQNNLLSALQNGAVTYSPNVTPEQRMPGRNEVTLPGMAAMPGSAQGGAAAAEPVVQIPKDARWSLYCASVSGPDRFSRAAQMKAYLLARSPFKDWYVVHNEQDSSLFYGFYSAIEKSERGSIKAHEDRQRISEWKDETGERPFASCFFTPITPPDPVAPAEWNLVNAPPNATSSDERPAWSVQIMAFRDTPLRKQAAVEAVKDFRSKGVEAYYYHGPSVSSVCLGAWPAEAIKAQDLDGGQTVGDQDDTLLVTDAPLPARYKGARMKTTDGHRVIPLAERVEIADPSLKAVFQEYPYHYVNYQAYSKRVKTEDGTMKERVSPSFLVKIPRVAPSVLNGGATPPNFLPNAAGSDRAVDPARQPAGTGRLRGLGN